MSEISQETDFVERAFEHKPEQDPIQASIDALRAAITSRNGQLTAISEQVRLGFEKEGTLRAVRFDAVERQIEEDRDAIQNQVAMLEKSMDAYIKSYADEMNFKFVGLAERLDKLEQRLPTKLFAEMASIDGALKAIQVENYAHLAACEGRIINRMNMIAGKRPSASQSKRRRAKKAKR